MMEVKKKSFFSNHLKGVLSGYTNNEITIKN